MTEEALPSTGNEVSGRVGGSVVQAGRIEGGVHIRYGTDAPPYVPPVPHQVPVVTGPFENREAELAELGALLGLAGPDTPDGPGGPDAAGGPDTPDGGSVRIAVLSGLPGVGKRTTVRRWAEQTGRHFPGGELYVDYAALREGARGADVTEGLASALRGLGVQESFLPSGRLDRFNLFRTRTEERAVLIVIEDVMDPAEVSTLVPKAPGSVVLATSSPVLAARTDGLGELLLDGARLLPLDPLDAECGTRLLARLCGMPRVAAEPAAAARLVALCGGLPMALRVVGARLATHPRLTLGELAGELEDEEGRLAALSGNGERQMSTVLTTAYRQLPERTAALYRRLGLLPAHTFDLATAALAADAAPSAVRARLHELDAARLLGVEPDGRYRLHDLVRLHARERAAEEEAPDAERALVARVLTHRLRTTASADRALRADRLRIVDLAALLDDDEPDPFAERPGDEPGARAGRALDWLVAERANTLAVLRAGVRHEFDEQVWRLAEVQCALYLHQRHVTEWAECAQAGAEAAARVGAKAAEARLRSLLSRPLMDLRHDDRAREALERAGELAGQTPHLVLRASVQEFTGRYWDRFDSAQAATAYQRALALNEQAGEPRGAAIARYFLGCAQHAGGDQQTALRTLGQAHDALLACPEPDVRMAARALLATGRVRDALGDPAGAQDAYRRARDIFRERRAAHYEAEALEALAELAGRTGDRAAVREYLGGALEIHEAGGSPRVAELRAQLEELGAEPGASGG